MLLCLMKYSRPDIAYVTWELSMVIYGAKQASFLKMHCVIKYVFDTRNLGLKIEPNWNKKELWDVVYFINSVPVFW